MSSQINSQRVNGRIIIVITRTKKTHLPAEFLRDNLFGVVDVQVGQVDQDFTHTLVECDGVRFLDEFANDLSILIFNDEDLKREMTGFPWGLHTSSGFTMDSIITKRSWDRVSA